MKGGRCKRVLLVEWLDIWELEPDGLEGQTLEGETISMTYQRRRGTPDASNMPCFYCIWRPWLTLYDAGNVIEDNRFEAWH
jgi:hypothetical protein